MAIKIKTLIITLMCIFLVILVALLFAFFVINENEENNDSLFCTQDAKLCPSGTYVGRNSSHNCEFDPCPHEINNTNNSNFTDQNISLNACVELGCKETSAIYAGSKESDKYYPCSCGYANNILPGNLICFISDNDAVNDGREKVEC